MAAAQRMEFAVIEGGRGQGLGFAPDAPPPDLDRHRHVHVHLTPFAFPGEIAPQVGDPRRAMLHWSTGALRPMGDLCSRLSRSPRSLVVRYRVESDDVEILGRVPTEPDLVPLALIGYGLTAEECRVALNHLGAAAHG